MESNFKNDTKELIYKTETDLKDIENRLVVAKREMGMERDGLEFGVGRCKLLHLEWINKVLMYSTGTCIQYPVINHNGK